MSAAGDEVQRLEHLIAMDQQALLSLFGQEIGGATRGEGDGASWIERAREWLDVHLSEIRSAICGNREILDSTGAEQIMLIADALAGLLHKPPAFTLAAILASRGIASICD